VTTFPLDAQSSLQSGVFEDNARALLNILEDFTEEKSRLEDTQRAILNMLEDFSGDKAYFEETQRAILNILDDFTGEKHRLEESQRAMLNILEDFDVERTKADIANRDLRDAFDSLRRAKEAADAANSELEAFSYSVSHDLRAPLQSIDGFSLALLEDYENLLDDRGNDYLRRVRNATQRMAQLIDDLLKLSRLTRGELNLATVDLSAIARALTEELRKSQPERQVSFHITDGLTATGDPNLLKVVLDNLLANAWKFTGKKEVATIEFSAVEVNGQVAYFVRDNGAGFDMTYADKLFATFQRLHLEREFQGTGIGLSLVQRVIRRHGGEVWAEGRVGEGASFYFTLNSPFTRTKP
jgi:light-regulated signal transduction histidine kinase (bacteriophytochrome)